MTYCEGTRLKAQAGKREKMPDTSTCPRTAERFKRLVRKNPDSQNNTHLSTRDTTIIPKLSSYVKG
ncbi:hypothetical protein E2C01_041442 [Portunus trituberculatus]|uniref:Uncharacterized protein n=1 Tax=Portunus trituberculatus TaxID=210409 RepID=A0A5B7FRX0_PORTR|nr:hypothetical protein [Portunus trituberculatus]